MRSDSTLEMPSTALAALAASCLVATYITARPAEADSRTKPRGVQSKEVSEANKRGDVEFLDKVCSGELAVGVGLEFARKNACAFAKVHKESRSALAADCGTVVERFRTAAPTGRDYLTKMAVKLAGCGKFTEVFELVAPFTRGKDLLDHLADQKFPIEAELVTYAKTRAGARFLELASLRGESGPTRSARAMQNIAGHLADRKLVGHCPLLANAVTGARQDVQLGALPYFAITGCPEAIAVATRLLGSDAPDARIAACNLLGRIGSTRVVPKLESLGKTDAHVVVVTKDGAAVKTYPVRDACTAAAGQVGLRR